MRTLGRSLKIVIVQGISTVRYTSRKLSRISAGVSIRFSFRIGLSFDLILRFSLMMCDCFN